MRGTLVFGLGLGIGALLGACGNVHESPDAAIPSIDAAPDGPPTLARRWVIDRQLVPTNNTQAREYGLDLNGDSSVDNQLGMVLGTLAAQGFDIQGATDAAIDRGQILMLGDATLTGSAATFTLYTGATPQPPPCTGPADPVCRRHLGGNGSFTVAATSARDTPLSGTVDGGGVLTAGPGHLQVWVAMDAGAPIRFNLIGARVKLAAVSEAGFPQSVIAGAVSQAELDTNVYPALQQNFAARVMADCPSMTPPTCGCPSGSTGATLLSLFDTNPKDCTISLAEIKGNTLIQSLLAPDVIVEGQQAVSFGFAATSVRAAFAP